MPLTMLNLSAMRSTYRPHTQPIPLSFRQRSSDMHLGSIGSSEGKRKPGGIKSVMLPDGLCLGAAYPHTV